MGCEEIFFDTLLISNGKIENLQYHYKRFVKTVKYLKLQPIIDKLTAESWYQMLEKNMSPNQSVLRVGFWQGCNNGVTSLISYRNLRDNTNIKVSFHPSANLSSGNLSLRYKFSNSLARSFLSLYKVEADDIIFVNEHNHICETTKANIYLLRDGELITPPLKDGLLGGTKRAKFLSQQTVSIGGEIYPLKERSIKKKELTPASQIYLSNSLIGLSRATFYPI